METPAGSTGTEASAAIAGPTVRPLLRFRPDIEGLRAVAVGLVVVLHFGVTGVSGGYVGVDVFFVISGFLITSLLIDEVRSTRRVSILAFYGRRARRILPAACFVIAVTVVVAYLRLGALSGRATAIDGQWAAGFAANFRFIRQGTDYFATNLPPSPLQHYWSLAVEEQFYLVWPTVLFALVAFGRRLGRATMTLQIGIVAIVAVSLAWSVHLSRINPTNAYFSPLTRAWELGAGALVAVFSIVISRAPAGLRAAATWIGLGMIAVAAFALSASTVFPGYAALLPVGGTALAIGGGIGQPARNAGVVLGWAPLRWLGKISFSLYLWHWPVIVIAEERSATPLSNVARVACAVFTLVLSIATYYAIEHPLRSTKLLRVANPSNSWERSRKPLAVGAAAIVVAVSVSVYTNNRAAFAINRADRATPAKGSGLEPASSLRTVSGLSAKDQVTSLQQQVHTLVQQGLALDKVPVDVMPPVTKVRLDPRFTPCLQRRNETDVKPCVFGQTTSSRILVDFGDSHAMHWAPALDIYAKQAGYRLVTVFKIACPVPSLQQFSQQGPYPACTTWRANALKYIQSLRPAVVVMTFSFDNLLLGKPPNLKLWGTGLATSVRALRLSGARIVQIGNNPTLEQDPGLCLSRPGANPKSCTTTFGYRESGATERAVDQSFGATYIDVEPWFCVDGKCPVIIDKRVAYRDVQHLSPEYVSDLVPILSATLRAAGLR